MKSRVEHGFLFFKPLVDEAAPMDMYRFNLTTEKEVIRDVVPQGSVLQALDLLAQSGWDVVTIDFEHRVVLVRRTTTFYESSIGMKMIMSEPWP